MNRHNFYIKKIFTSLKAVKHLMNYIVNMRRSEYNGGKGITEEGVRIDTNYIRPRPTQHPTSNTPNTFTAQTVHRTESFPYLLSRNIDK